MDSVRTTARIEFVTQDDSSDLPDFALGYGLYFINIEYPHESCGTPTEYSWSSSSWAIDFRDSRFGIDYGTGADGELTFYINIGWSAHKTCGSPSIQIYLTSAARDDSLYLSNMPIGADYGPYNVIPINEVYEQSSPEYDFHVNSNIYRGLDTTQNLNLSGTFLLAHSAEIGTNFALRQLDALTLSNYEVIEGFAIERDSVVFTLSDACVVSTVGFRGNFNIYGRLHNPVQVVSASSENATGFIIEEGVSSDIGYAIMKLVKPIIVNGFSYSTKIRNTTIIRTENDGCGNHIFLDRPFAIRLENTVVTIDSCIVTVIDSARCLATGILLENVRSGSRIHNSEICGFPGHGIEIVDGQPFGTAVNPEDCLWIYRNQIRNNRMYGVHIRGANARPYLSYNYIHHNGWFGDNVQEQQSRKFDAVNVKQASGIFQNNTFDSSGAYGLHASFNATLLSTWGTGIPTYGYNCMRGNYFNCGGSGNSVISFGDTSIANTGRNAFTSPRATWGNNLHVTLRNNCIGEFQNNAWENPYLSATPYPIDTLDEANSRAYPEYSGTPISCTENLSPGGARNDSIANENEIDAIRIAVSNGNWQQARDLSMQLLESSNCAYSATFATTTLVKALQELDDLNIPSFLSNAARDTSLYHSSIAANYSAVRAFTYTEQYDSSIAMAYCLGQRFLYSDIWRMASIITSFIQNDYLGNYYAAEDILLSVLERYPDDADAIGAYYSIKGTLPDGLSKRHDERKDDKYDHAKHVEMEVFPNPARSELTVHFSLQEDSYVHLSLCDNSGRIVTEMNDAKLYESGIYSKTWPVKNIHPGYYHVVLRTNGRVSQRIIKIAP